MLLNFLFQAGSEDGKSTSEESLNADEYAGGGMGLFGLMSWISGIILLVVYTSNDHDSTIYNSFQTAIYFNLIIFSIVRTLYILYFLSDLIKKSLRETLGSYLYDCNCCYVPLRLYL